MIHFFSQYSICLIIWRANAEFCSNYQRHFYKNPHSKFNACQQHHSHSQPCNAFSLKPSPTKPLHKQTVLLVSIPNGRHSVVHFPCPRKTGWTAGAVSYNLVYLRPNAVYLLIDSPRKVGDGQRQSDIAKQRVLIMYHWSFHWYTSALNSCLSFLSHVRSRLVYVAQCKWFKLVHLLKTGIAFDDN